jgi:para-nitrobenzyl esterase
MTAREGVVVVTINYRLGPFGWLSHAALRHTAHSAAEASGNFGLLDILRALAWVHDNISAFGGDPSNVTVFGESAGGWDVFALLVSPQAGGLFSRAIVQSGGDMTTPVADAENLIDDRVPGLSSSSGELLLQLLMNDGARTRQVAKQQVNSMGAAKTATYLRGKTFDQLMAAYRAIADRNEPSGYLIGFARGFPSLFRDGVVIPKGGPKFAITKGVYDKVPLIIGTTRDEYSIFLDLPSFGTPTGDAMGFHFVDKTRYTVATSYLSRLWKADGVDGVANLVSGQQSSPVFVYRFDWGDLTTTPYIDGMPMAARHGMDLPFVFGTFSPALAPGGPDLPGTMEDLSEAMMDYWGAFARNGIPGRGTRGELVEWRSWSPRGDDPATTLFLNTVANGGITMGREVITKEALLHDLERDPHFTTPEERCNFVHDLLGVPAGSHFSAGERFAGEPYKSFFSLADYSAFSGGACAGKAH